MSQPIWLPADLAGAAFSVASAERAGIGQARRDSALLLRPFTGVRATSVATDVLARARDYSPRMRRHHAFGGLTAIRLLGLPWMYPWGAEEIIELAVPGNHYAPRSRGVRGHRLAAHRLQIVEVQGLPVLSPLAAVMDVADRLEVEELAALFDALLTESTRYPGLAWRPMHSSLEELREGVDAWGAGPARTRARIALPYVRGGVDSFPETRTRVLLMRRGLPEPERQPAVQTHIGILHPDAGWPEYRVCFEYEGDHHRTSREQWHSDIERFEAFVRAGWAPLRVTAQDLRPKFRDRLVVRARRSLLDRGWREGSGDGSKRAR